MEGKGKRLADAIEYLKEEGVVRNLEDVAEKVDRSRNNISSAINGDKRYLSDKFLKHFNACFKNIFSLDWLLKGEGAMCCSTASDAEIFGEQKTSSETSKDERIKFLEEQVSFLREQLDFYKNRK